MKLHGFKLKAKIAEQLIKTEDHFLDSRNRKPDSETGEETESRKDTKTKTDTDTSLATLYPMLCGGVRTVSNHSILNARKHQLKSFLGTWSQL